jgi:tetratricopeptide (TPR) repeat protein
MARHLLHGSEDDLDEAIVWHDRALGGSVPGRVGAARLSASRAYALRIRAQRTRDPQDVARSVEAFRTALAAEPDAARLPDVLAALGSALDLRHDTVDDITATIEVRRRACRLADPGDPYCGPWTADLANSLRLRAALLGGEGEADLAEARPLHVEAVAATSPRHPEYATVLSNLAGSHRNRYVRTGDPADLDAALGLLRRTAAVASAPAIRRFVAAETGGRLAADTGRWAEACDAYDAAIDLLPAAAWRGADRPGKEQPLRDARWLAVEAAAAALHVEDPARAVTLLERGRSVLWNQQLETATDLPGLRDVAPELADRLDAARVVLDTDIVARDTRRVADARVAAAVDWDSAMAELHARPELSALVSAPGPVALPDALTGTVALIVVSRYRRDAVLLDRTGCRVVPLPELDLDTLADQVGGYFSALGAVVDPADRAERHAAERQLTALLTWLGDAVVAPVLDTVPAGSRLWWCPTGPFTVLPLHAAGPAPDRVVSSYTPTVAALARASQFTDTGEQRVLGVAVPEAPGQLLLPGAPAEVDQLEAALPSDVTFTRPDVATRAVVGPALRTHSWLHLACHAEQDLSHPSRAALVLADGRLGLSAIARRPGRSAEGAYLSACQSALGGVELSDEALHLAAAVQYAGFRRVIATLWPVTRPPRPTGSAARLLDAVRRRRLPPRSLGGRRAGSDAVPAGALPRRPVAVGAVRAPRPVRSRRQPFPWPDVVARFHRTAPSSAIPSPQAGDAADRPVTWSASPRRRHAFRCWRGQRRSSVSCPGCSTAVPTSSRAAPGRFSRGRDGVVPALRRPSGALGGVRPGRRRLLTFRLVAADRRLIAAEPLQGHEFVAHVFVAVAGPEAAADYRYLADLWSRCFATFGMDGLVDPYPGELPAVAPTVDEGEAVVAVRSRRAGAFTRWWYVGCATCCACRCCRRRCRVSAGLRWTRSGSRYWRRRRGVCSVRCGSCRRGCPRPTRCSTSPRSVRWWRRRAGGGGVAVCCERSPLWDRSRCGRLSTPRSSSPPGTDARSDASSWWRRPIGTCS